MIPYEEKRDFIRIKTECRLAYKPVDAATPKSGSCINLSGSGILFTTADPVAPGKAMEVHIRPNYKITPPLTAFVEVVRCDPTDLGQYAIAGAIKGIKGD
jgi:hypothetical protein